MRDYIQYVGLAGIREEMLGRKTREDERKMVTTKEKAVQMRTDTYARPAYIEEDTTR